MKSVLVEALRRAKDGGGEDPLSQSDSHSEEKSSFDESAVAGLEQPESDPVEVTIEVGDLRLMESTADIALQDDYDEFDDESLLDLQIEQASHSAPHQVLEEESSQQVQRRRHDSSIAAYLPALCLVFVLLAAISHLLYNSMEGEDTVSSLSEVSMSSEPGVDSGIRGAMRFTMPKQESDVDIQSDDVPDTPTELPPLERTTTAQYEEQDIQPEDIPDDRAFDAVNAAYAAYHSGDKVTAETLYREALRISPRHANALEGLAALLLEDGRVEESIHHFRMLLALNPDNMRVVATLLASGDGQGAMSGESAIKYLLQNFPESADLHFALGTLLARQSRWPDARVAFEKASRLDPTNADYHFNLGVSLEHLRRYSDASERYRSALASAGTDSSIDRDFVLARLSELSVLGR